MCRSRRAWRLPDFKVVDQSGKALKADVAIGGTNLGTRRGKVELDWCAIAPDAFLPPACSWRHAAGARADGSGRALCRRRDVGWICADLGGRRAVFLDWYYEVQCGDAQSTLMVQCYDAATQQLLTDVAVDLVPLDGQVGVRWTAGSRQQQRVAVGRAYRVVARGGRLRQTTPAVDEDVVFGRADWAQLDGETPAELRVLLERRVATVEVRVLDASLQQETLTDTRGVKSGRHISRKPKAGNKMWTYPAGARPCGRCLLSVRWTTTSSYPEALRRLRGRREQRQFGGDAHAALIRLSKSVVML